MSSAEQTVEVESGLDYGIRLAIIEGARAGLHRSAARQNPKTAATWDGFAEVHTKRVAALLGSAIKRLGAEDAGPCARGE